MKKCPYNKKECRHTMGCSIGICAEEVDDKIDDWSKEHGWED